VKVTISKDGDAVLFFDAKIDLSGLRLPSHGRVYVEAYHRASYMRFDYGKVSDITTPRDRRLTDIEGGATPMFRVKVIDETSEHGQVLAEADALSPLDAEATAANHTPILPVVKADLGQEIWRVQFDTLDDRPVLELNKGVEGIERLAVGDDRFFALVYPGVIRTILHRVLRVEECFDLDGPSDNWCCQWLRFACALPGIMRPPRPESDDDPSVVDRQLEWIDDVTASFCAHHKVLERFVRMISSEERI
jgi:hypothetical protein